MSSVRLFVHFKRDFWSKCDNYRADRYMHGDRNNVGIVQQPVFVCLRKSGI